MFRSHCDRFGGEIRRQLYGILRRLEHCSARIRSVLQRLQGNAIARVRRTMAFLTLYVLRRPVETTTENCHSLLQANRVD